MPDDAKQKTCVACGADCAGRPRVRDPKGRYYCKPCYDDAAARRTPAPDAGVSADLLAELAAIPSAPVEVEAVPVASAPAAGFSVHAASAVPDRSRRRSERGAVWPLVVGILAAGVGGLGMLVYGFSLYGVFDALPWKQSFVMSALVLAAAAFPFLMSLWLHLAGVGIARRDDRAVGMMQRWAIVVLILTALLATCMGSIFFMEGAREVREEVTGELGAGLLVLGAVIVSFLVMPVGLLVWFRLGFVQREIATWD